MISSCTFVTAFEKRFESKPRSATANGSAQTNYGSSGTRVLRANAERGVRKKTPAANPCWGVEFPGGGEGAVRPHYVLVRATVALITRLRTSSEYRSDQ